MGEEEKEVYAYFFRYTSEAKYEEDADKDAESRENDAGRIVISPQKFAAAWTKEEYSFDEVQSAVRDRVLKDSIVSVSDSVRAVAATGRRMPS